MTFNAPYTCDSGSGKGYISMRVEPTIFFRIRNMQIRGNNNDRKVKKTRCEAVMCHFDILREIKTLVELK